MMTRKSVEAVLINWWWNYLWMCIFTIWPVLDTAQWYSSQKISSVPPCQLLNKLLGNNFLTFWQIYTAQGVWILLSPSSPFCSFASSICACYWRLKRVWSCVFHWSASAGSERSICFCLFFCLLQKWSIIVPPPFQSLSWLLGPQPSNILRDLRSALNENHCFAAVPGLCLSISKLEGKNKFFC